MAVILLVGVVLYITQKVMQVLKSSPKILVELIIIDFFRIGLFVLEAIEISAI